MKKLIVNPTKVDAAASEVAAFAEEHEMLDCMMADKDADAYMVALVKAFGDEALDNIHFSRG